MAWTATRRDLNLITRNSGELEEKKLTYIKPNNITATQIKTAVMGLVGTLTTSTYVNGEIMDIYDLNESAASEEE